jgi:hypothetical protein
VTVDGIVKDWAEDLKSNPIGDSIVLEYERRTATDRFWLSMADRRCCGTMRECRLKR